MDLRNEVEWNWQKRQEPTGTELQKGLAKQMREGEYHCWSARAKSVVMKFRGNFENTVHSSPASKIYSTTACGLYIPQEAKFWVEVLLSKISWNCGIHQMQITIFGLINRICFFVKKWISIFAKKLVIWMKFTGATWCIQNFTFQLRNFPDNQWNEGLCYNSIWFVVWRLLTTCSK